MPTQRRCVVNAQGILSNPNIALDAAKIGRLDTLKPGATTRVDARALSDACGSGLSAIGVTLGYVAGPTDPRKHTLDDIAEWDAFIEASSGQLCKAVWAADIKAAHASGRVGVVYGFQSPEMLGEDVAAVSAFSVRGVRTMQLSYNGRSRLADGCMVKEDVGLSVLGRSMLAEMNAQRVLVDLSHSSQKTCREEIAKSSASVAITHTGCRALCDTPRNTGDAELRLLASRGGVVGIYAMPFLRQQGQPLALDLIHHLEHAIQVCGEDHVGLGTDGSVTAVDDVPTYMRYLAEAVAQRKQSGIGASGENEAVALFLPDLCGPNQFQSLAEQLQSRGHTGARIDKLLGLNFLRLMGEVWGG